MKVGSTIFQFSGHAQVAQEKKLFKAAGDKSAEQSVNVSISEEGLKTYRSSVQENQQSPTYEQLTEQRKALADIKYEKLNKFEEDPQQHQEAKSIIGEWKELVAKLRSISGKN